MKNNQIYEREFDGRESQLTTGCRIAAYTVTQQERLSGEGI